MQYFCNVLNHAIRTVAPLQSEKLAIAIGRAPAPSPSRGGLGGDKEEGALSEVHCLGGWEASGLAAKDVPQ
jgi:hypothetical protein